MKPLSLTVAPADAGRRLDHLLATALPNISRASLQKAIVGGHCLVDGLERRKPGTRLHAGQRLEFSPPESATTLAAEDGQVRVIWRDASILVCDKPAGLTVHPCPSCPSSTLIQRLIGHFPQIGNMEGLRPGIVHRLDKDTSGILLVALDEPSRLTLSRAFARREVHKEYLALVSGRAPDEGECRQPLGRHPTAKIKMAVTPENRGGKPAHTSWRRLWTSEDGRLSLLAVTIMTGRTHQIRVHMAHAGHPLLGDRVYAPPAVRALAPRQMLHAWRIAFPHPVNGATLRFTRPPPDDMIATALDACRRMQRIVITGLPGCGKSALTGALARKGIPAISADDVVAQLYAANGAVALWLSHLMGGRLLANDGSVSKDALFAAMNADGALRRDVETRVHALVREAVETFWQREEERGAPLAAAEIPLYFECAWQDAFTPKPLIVCVRCSRETRRQRLMEHRGWSDAKISSIEAWQWPEDKKNAAADMLVDNGGTLEDLALAGDNLLLRLSELRQEAEAARAGLLASLVRSGGNAPAS